MSKRKPKGNQVDTINRYSPFVQESFDLPRQDAFVTSLGVDFKHYKAMPSPIGKNDRGSYRRSDGVDTISSNGMIYQCAGIFTGTITDNSRQSRHANGGIMEPTQSRVVLPRFYNDKDVADGKTIYLAPGDRLYISDPNADVKVSNYQEMVYEADIDNIPMFPIIEMEMCLRDSRNIEYSQGTDYIITQEGNIRWLSGGKNPGIDPDTEKGRIYSIRYLYNAYWYVMELPKEVRITNVTTGGVRSPTRMPYYAVIVREFMFHNQNKGDQTNQLKTKTPQRVNKEPVQSINPAKPVILVDMNAIDTLSEDDGEQS